jgi:hypothetical protein
MQHKHDFVRSTPRPALLVLSPELVSHPALRLATALFVVARRLLVRRRSDTVTRLWQTLLAQREWVVAALVLERLVKDYHLRKTLPALLVLGRLPDGFSVDVNYTPLTPAARADLSHRLALLRLEDIGPPPELFHDLCKRMWRVLTLLARAGHFGAGTQRRANASEGAYADGRSVDAHADTHPADGRHDVPIQPWHAQRRVENVLQGTYFFPRLFSHLILTLPRPALGILGTLIYTRQLPGATCTPGSGASAR